MRRLSSVQRLLYHINLKVKNLRVVVHFHANEQELSLHGCRQIKSSDVLCDLCSSLVLVEVRNVKIYKPVHR